MNPDGLIGHVEVQAGDSVILLFDHPGGRPETLAFLRLYVGNVGAAMKGAKDATALASSVGGCSGFATTGPVPAWF